MTKTVGLNIPRLQRAAEGENAAACFFPKITLELQAERLSVKSIKPRRIFRVKESCLWAYPDFVGIGFRMV
ncbi:MAG: hypothetical protein K2N36_06465 [Ruminiclostridium sp.]|nr:hypothetical protein [Ruminiclostridium sp.]